MREAPAGRATASVQADGLLLLRLYRSLVPRWLRARAARLIPPERRTGWLLRAAERRPARIARRLSIGWFRLRHPRLTRGDRVLVQSETGIVVARPVPAPAPLQARRDTLDLVCAALRTAGVPFHCLRTLSATESAVAVSADDRAAAITALTGASIRAAAYAGPVGAPRLPGRRTWRRARRLPAVMIVAYFCTPDGSWTLGRQHGCTVEFWQPDAETGELVAPRANRVLETVAARAPTVRAPEHVFTTFAPAQPPGPARPAYPTWPQMLGVLADEVDFPIDVVYTWVDGEDPAWRDRRDAELAAVGQLSLNEQAANESRYISRDELRYSLRGLALYAPWVNHIWIVTDDQVPDWLDISHPKITVVDHKEIFADPSLLPTFNSHAIESQLHHIDGLSEHFLYFNDDVFLGRPVVPEQFFHANGLAKFFLSNAKIAQGARSLSDVPVLAAGKNNRRLIEEEFGVQITRKMKHVPHPLRRSVLYEIEERFGADSARTAGHRFRHPDDISIASSLHHYYALRTGRAVPGDIRYAYRNLADPRTPQRLRHMLRQRSFHAFCLNDTDSDVHEQAMQQELTQWFLDGYFPVAGPYEIP